MTLTIPLAQGSPEWVEARRDLITATDIPVLLGVSPYKCEADLADEKLGRSTTTATLRMRMGSALEGFIGDEYERVTGRRVRRFDGMVRHGVHAWAAASPDFEALDDRRLVEAKWTTYRDRFADGVPQDIEAQVAWQLGVGGYDVADIAALVAGEELLVFEQRHDPALFANLVKVALDFRARLAAGGPFSRDLARLKADYPQDSGEIVEATPDIEQAVHALAAYRTQRKAIEEAETTLEAAIKSRMAEASVLRGSDFTVTWRRTKDGEQTDWRSVADGLLRQLPETERTALVGIHTSVRPGFRPFRLVMREE